MMLRYLLESQPRPARRLGGMGVSVGVHTAIIALAIVATARATPSIRTVTAGAHPLIYNARITPLPITRRTRPTPHPDGLRVFENVGARVVGPSVDWVTRVQPVDIAAPITRRADFEGVHLGVGVGFAADRIDLASGNDSIFTLSTVEKPAMALPDNPRPVYPVSLRSALIEGIVVARFVVDTAGRAEARSIEIVATTHRLFGDAVRQAVLRSRYLPAIAAGRPVRQLVEQRFAFTLTR